VVYGIRTPSTTSGSLVSVELPSGRILGQFVGSGGRGGSLAISPDGSRGYFFDGQQLHELALPGLQLRRSTPAPDGITSLGYARVVAVAPDGTEVYLETVDRPGDPTSERGIAVYDVAQGMFVRQIRLAPPAWGAAACVGELYALSQHRLAMLCGSDHVVRMDVASGDQHPATVPVNGGNAILSADRRHLYVVSGAGQIEDVDLDQMVVARSASLTPDVECPRCVPFQPLHLSTDGQRLTLVAAPGPAEVGAAVNGTVVWIVDLSSLTRVAEVPVGPHTADALLTPDGRGLLVSRIELDPRDEGALRLIEVLSGWEVGRWPGSMFGLEIRT
jgi:hypothetical protein